MRSQKELALDGKLTALAESFHLSGKMARGLQLLLCDEEIQAAQEYANTVSIVRLGYNDHGPVHMRTVAFNALYMLGLLRKAEIKTSLEKDECGDFEDSLTAVLFAAMLHDIGMGVGRQDHELHSVYMAYPILDRILAQVYEGDWHKRTMVRAMALEGISGHMGNRTVHSLEAGVVQVADGCDMTKGRARIPIALNHNARAGSIHQYSANSIEDVRIGAGAQRPIRVDIVMSSEIGLFQVEEVLLGKIAASAAKPFIELYAQVRDEETRRYL
ncbi:MAG: HD domain-containing protein [Spirochaetaceae bacterium]|jgi:metal-dependent HD superfamily phosphatase/phosphodiesterase|nr:HD domain-containing protein [Spirochaetaceae bacterium]